MTEEVLRQDGITQQIKKRKMSNKTKNIITNIIGIILLVVNVVMYYKDDETLASFVTILVISLALFLFKGTETKEWLKKALSKFSS